MSHSHTTDVYDIAHVEATVRGWLETVVIGLNLCPFAAFPVRMGTLRLVVSESRDAADLYGDLQTELQRLDDTPATQLDTTIVVVPHLLAHFRDYNAFLDEADALLRRGGWSGVYQLASFHPDYRFDGTLPDDRGNYTNRAPYPLLHLLREASVEAAVARHPSAEGIPEANIRRMEMLTPAQLRELFPYVDRNS